MTLYDGDFFDEIDEPTRASARFVVPILVERLKPRSVVDFGCGRGSWLEEFRRNGVNDIVGVDGSWVQRNRLAIPESAFRVVDLTGRVVLDRPFDLALCLEVAEHLSASAADCLVESLVDAAPIVLFSAAVPYQGGVGHRNEQWPDYWARRFKMHGYFASDWVRPIIWSAPQVAFWYAQNCICFARTDSFDVHPCMRAYAVQDEVRALIHPQNYLAHADPHRVSLGRLLRVFPIAAVSWMRRRWRK